MTTCWTFMIIVELNNRFFSQNAALSALTVSSKFTLWMLAESHTRLLSNSNAFNTVYCHIMYQTTREPEGSNSVAHMPDHTLHLIYLLLARKCQQWNIFKSETKLLFTKGCPSIVSAPCYANQYAETESGPLPQRDNLRNLYINYRYALGKSRDPLCERLKPRTGQNQFKLDKKYRNHRLLT